LFELKKNTGTICQQEERVSHQGRVAEKLTVVKDDGSPHVGDRRGELKYRKVNKYIL
jgi:hypothetical protein